MENIKSEVQGCKKMGCSKPVLIFDYAPFTLCCTVNSKNKRCWLCENPHAVRDVTFISP
jgi:hypothetical protein